ncbi:hypothetical protein M501DRAFT_1061798 [Patellaria atrata CBS 101060]|uniref:Uncharacterized protein n=1 Tax=Patellaria atrata CBS 101060 TaxID=1346257 RepID=A0A9P4VM43_9PEZI|nr:hypothetical protein M501DRAFT_1061798 [Patellaria atrata CBS 101060]
MSLKRKRSSDFSPSSTSSFPTSSRSSQSPSPIPRATFYTNDAPPQTISGWGFPRYSLPLGDMLGLRTRKRFRDNRPDIEVIHQNTLEKLYDAQKSQPNSCPLPSNAALLGAAHHAPPQKSTLHSFWNLPQAPPNQNHITAQFTLPSVEKDQCEDCEEKLSMSENIDVAMTGDDLFERWACQRCARRVCNMCAVVNEERLCLNCTRH